MDYVLQAKGLPTTIYVAAAGASRDAAGEPTYGSPASRSAYVQHVSITTHAGQQGEQIEYDTLIMTTAKIGKRDRVWLPGVDQTDNSLAVLPMATSQVFDQYGSTSHWETYLHSEGAG